MCRDKIAIRIARAEDAEELLGIYAPYVERTAVTFEYEAPSAEEFANRITRTLTCYPYLVAESGKELVGYTYAGRLHERPAYDWSVETSVYVRMDCRGMGVGRKLYDSLEEELLRQGITNVNACIAYPEKEDEYLTYDSVRFHEKMGYRMVGQFHECAYKFGRWYHMVWMEKQIGEHKKEPPAVKTFAELCASEGSLRGIPQGIPQGYNRT